MQDKDTEKARAQAREKAVAAVVEQFKQGIPREVHHRAPDTEWR